MIKKWLERLPSRLPLTQQACTLVQTSCMQAEIDELRQENAAVMRNNNELLDQRFGLMEQVGTLNAENARLRSALVGLIGADSEQELRQMEATMRLLPAPEEDKAVSINAIHALLATLPVNAEVSGSSTRPPC